MGTVTMAHMRADTLEHYSLGQLTETAIGRVEEHLLVCGGCREHLDDIEFVLCLIRAVHAPLTMSSGSGLA